MLHNQYWHITKPSALARPMPGKESFLFELTEDDVAFLWPVNPTFSSLCRECIHRYHVNVSVCFDFVQKSFPCSFSPSSTFAENQDMESYLVEGDSEDAGGDFTGPVNFLSSLGLVPEQYTIRSIGIFPTITAARDEFIHFQSLPD